jgi:hypothetical protein
MRPYLITAKLMRPSNMKRFPTPGLLFRDMYYVIGQFLTYFCELVLTVVEEPRDRQC